MSRLLVLLCLGALSVHSQEWTERTTHLNKAIVDYLVTFNEADVSKERKMFEERVTERGGDEKAVRGIVLEFVADNSERIKNFEPSIMLKAAVIFLYLHEKQIDPPSQVVERMVDKDIADLTEKLTASARERTGVNK